MKKIFSLLVAVVMICFFAVAGQAEVIVNERGITAKLANSSLAQVITQVVRHAKIDLVVVNTEAYRKAVISDVFEELSIEVGLERLLNGWNYGWRKDPSTGALRTLIVVSHRVDPLYESKVPAKIPAFSNTNIVEDLVKNVLGESSDDIVYEEPYLTVEELINSAPPEMREMIANRLNQNK